MIGELRILPREVPLNRNERVLESGKLLTLMQRESFSCADSAIVTEGIKNNNQKEIMEV